MPRRRLVVTRTDVLVINGLEIDAEVLMSITNPDTRLLWAFVRQADQIQPIAYNEDRVIWLQPGDMEHSDAT